MPTINQLVRKGRKKKTTMVGVGDVEETPVVVETPAIIEAPVENEIADVARL